jgi:hypothetical protein
MNEQSKNVVRAASYLLGGDRNGRAARVAQVVLDRAVEREGGKMTKRLFLGIAALLLVAGLGFVAYRLLVLELVMNLVEKQG